MRVHKSARRPLLDCCRRQTSYQASPSLTLTFPDAIDVPEDGSGMGPSPLSSMFRFMAAVADEDRSLAMMYLGSDKQEPFMNLKVF